MSAARAQKGGVIKTEDYYDAIAHDPFVNRPHGNLTQSAGALFFIFRQCIPDLNSAHTHANAMSLSGAHQARRFQALRCAGATRLSHKDEFDAFGCRRCNRKIQSDYACAKSIIPNSIIRCEVGLDYALSPRPPVGFRLVHSRGDSIARRHGLIARGFLSRGDCLDVFVLSLLNLEDGAPALGSPQGPPHVVAITAQLRQSLARSSALEIEAVDKFLRRAHLNRSEDDFVKAFGHRANAVTTRRDFGAESSIGAGACLFDYFVGAVLEQRDNGSGEWTSLTVPDRAGDRRQRPLIPESRRRVESQQSRNHNQRETKT